MFTGLVETTGTLLRRTERGGEARLVLSAPRDGSWPRSPLELGESIAVEGVCLTVAAITPDVPVVFEADASAETLAKTTLGRLATGAAVNLERALAVGARLGGHIVSGHVDGLGKIAARTPLGGSQRVTFEAPAELMRFIAPKGSITVSGVSLTVNEVRGDRFDVVLVPHTRERTTLDRAPVSGEVNLEVDILARYVARLLEAGRDPGAGERGSTDAEWLERLAQAGYTRGTTP